MAFPVVDHAVHMLGHHVVGHALVEPIHVLITHM